MHVLKSNLRNSQVRFPDPAVQIRVSWGEAAAGRQFLGPCLLLSITGPTVIVLKREGLVIPGAIWRLRETVCVLWAIPHRFPKLTLTSKHYFFSFFFFFWTYGFIAGYAVLNCNTLIQERLLHVVLPLICGPKWTEDIYLGPRNVPLFWSWRHKVELAFQILIKKAFTDI